MGLRNYRKRYLLLICSSVILFVLGNQYFFHSIRKSLPVSYNISLVHVINPGAPPSALPQLSFSGGTASPVDRDDFAAPDPEDGVYEKEGRLDAQKSTKPARASANMPLRTGQSPVEKQSVNYNSLVKKQLVQKKKQSSKEKSKLNKKPAKKQQKFRSGSLTKNLPAQDKLSTSAIRALSSLHTSPTLSILNLLYNFDDEAHLQKCRELAIQTARKTLLSEMSDYVFVDNTTLEDHILEKGGRPIRNIVVTSWRSGSTFLGETLAVHAGTFYHYEPLLHFGIVQVRDNPLADDAINDLQSLLRCNYTYMSDYIDFGRNNSCLFNHNERMWKYCQTNRAVCFDPHFLGQMCSIFPIHAMKTVRLRLKLVRALLEDLELDVRVLYLVRDPRGTMQSRLHRDWCPNNPDCDNPQALCSDLEDDFYEAEKLRKEYPHRFRAVRFEDMTANIVAAAKSIFRFFRLHYVGLVDQFIANHTRKDYGGVSSTYRDTKAVPFHWIQDLQNNLTYVRRVQDSCSTAIRLWGYNPLRIPEDLKSPLFHPVNKPPWPDMTFSP